MTTPPSPEPERLTAPAPAASEQDRAEPPQQGPGPAAAPARPIGCFTPLSIAVVSAAVLLAAGLGLLAGRWSASGDEPAAGAKHTASVVMAVRDLARLESAQYHVERVIDLSDTQRRLFGLLETKDAILLVAAGDVSAGVDLGRLEAGDIEADPASGRVHVVLPPAEVLSSRLDNQRTYVHSRQTDLLAERRTSLEARARQEAEQSIVQAALESGILDRAEKNATRTVVSMLKSLGYTDVTVRVRQNGNLKD